jgi:hypothetical protein
MKLKRVLLALSYLMLGVGSISAYATSNEPTLKSILETEASGEWEELPFADLVNASWNVVSTTLNFSLISENADFAFKNSFLIKDDGVSTVVFAGSATPIYQSTFSYVLQDELSRIYFKTGDETSSKYKIYFNSLAKEYAFAYEDIKGGSSDNDYNDMVVTMRVAVAAVPEPESIAMLIAGLGLMGVVSRRKKTIVA